MGCCQGKQEVGYSQVSEKEPREDDSGSDDELAEHADDVVSVVGLEVLVYSSHSITSYSPSFWLDASVQTALQCWFQSRCLSRSATLACLFFVQM